MTESVVVKVRLKKADLHRLQRLARGRRTTKSDVIRQGLELLDQREARRRAIEGLVAMIRGREPATVRFRMR